ncbi:MAG: ASCH domain-containing protein [Planctomycetes bacterium]|jgi:hypothetical protein|nr:ASCH domain-containing protein [Planctomycetota bacterium]MCL4730911.1 ASCH domain-containing protein [Planctomycetota bacterium]
MLFRQQFLDGIKAGAITRAFRRWRRPTVKAGGTLLTPVGVVAIDSVQEVAADDLTTGDARAAGYASLGALQADIAGQRPGTLYRINLHFHGADPRIALRDRTHAGDLPDVLKRLAQMDACARGGPWTQVVLQLLRDNPGTRAGNLAPQAGRQTPDFKRDVRKLKALGLTESLGTGYRLSPRGRAVLKKLAGGQGIRGR